MNAFCDLLLLEWRNETNATGAYDCHECMLEAWRIQLESPLGYEDDFAEDFASVTESCGASGYSYSTPTPYRKTVDATGLKSSIPTSACPVQYCLHDSRGRYLREHRRGAQCLEL